MTVLRNIGLGLLLLVAAGAAARGLMVMRDWLSTGGVLGTRLLAVCFLATDVMISSSLIILLLVRDRRSPAGIERRLPFGGRWLWPLLLAVAILSYAGLAPTYLYLYLQMRK